MWVFVVDIPQLFIADCTALCRYSGNLSNCREHLLSDGGSIGNTGCGTTVCGLLLLLLLWSISQLWIEVVTYKKLNLNSVKNNEKVFTIATVHTFHSVLFFYRWHFFTLFPCQVNFPNTALPVWAQPISIKWTQSVIHVEHCAVGILVHCSGACLWWLKPLSIASP